MAEESFNLTALEKISANQSCFNAPEGSVQNLSVLAEEKSADLTSKPIFMLLLHRDYYYLIEKVFVSMYSCLVMMRFWPAKYTVDPRYNGTYLEGGELTQ
jgi:hypothetical protein